MIQRGAPKSSEPNIQNPVSDPESYHMYESVIRTIIVFMYISSGETDPLAKSPDSFDNDMEKGPLESETDSMAEYGDVDPSKFNEDGSFIGQYGAQKTTASDVAAPSAMSTFV
jgi:hypothetical protein